MNRTLLKTGLILVGIALICSLIGIGAGGFIPTEKTKEVTVVKYNHEGKFSYQGYSASNLFSGETTQPNPTLFPQFIEEMEILFSSSGIEGNTKIKLILEDKGGNWQKEIPVKTVGSSPVSFPLDWKEIVLLGETLNAEFKGEKLGELKALSEAELKVLSEAKLSELIEAKLSELSEKEVKALIEAKLSKLSEEELKGLNEAKLSEEVLNELKEAKLKDLSKTKLNEAKLKELIEARLKELKEAKLFEAKLNELIETKLSGLSQEKITELIEAKLSALSEAELKALNKAKLSELSEKVINGLKEAKLSELSEAKLNEAKLKELIEARLKALSEAKLFEAKLNELKLKELKEAKLNELKEAKLKEIEKLKESLLKRNSGFRLKIIAEAGTGKDPFAMTLEGDLSSSALKWKEEGFNKIERGFPGGDNWREGAFGYRVKLKKNEVFGPTALERKPELSQPSAVESDFSLFTAMIESLDIGFDYRFNSDVPINSLEEEVKVWMVMEELGRWKKSFVLLPPTKKQAKFALNFPLDVDKLREIAGNINGEMGGKGAQGKEQEITIFAQVHTIAETNSGIIDEVFDHQLKGKVGEKIEWGEKKGLTLTKAGTITKKIVEPNPLPPKLRQYSLIGLGVSFPIFCALAFLYWRERQKRSFLEEELKRNRKKYRELISEVTDSPPAREGEAIIDASSLEALVNISNNSLKPILLKVEPEKHTYWVVDGLTRYCYIMKEEKPED